MYYSYGKFAIGLSFYNFINDRTVNFGDLEDITTYTKDGDTIYLIKNLIYIEELGKFPYGTINFYCARGPEDLLKKRDFLLYIGDITNTAKTWCNLGVLGPVKLGGQHGENVTLQYIGTTYDNFMNKVKNKTLEIKYKINEYGSKVPDDSQGCIKAAINSIAADIRLNEKYLARYELKTDKNGINKWTPIYEPMPSMPGIYLQNNMTNVRMIQFLSSAIKKDHLFYIKNNKINIVPVDIDMGEEIILGRLPPVAKVNVGPDAQKSSMTKSTGPGTQKKVNAFRYAGTTGDLSASYNREFNDNLFHNLKYYDITGYKEMYTFDIAGMSPVNIGDKVSLYIGDNLIPGFTVYRKRYNFNEESVSTQFLLIKIK